MLDDRAFTKLTDFLIEVPAIKDPISHGTDQSGWWCKFLIEINHEIAWNVVQEFGYVLNNLSLEAKLPTKFFPTSPPPYLNGGPDEFLSWVIECDSLDFRPGTCADWLKSRLPNPVEDPLKWREI